MSRHAILVANKAGTADDKTNVDLRRARDQLQDFAETLEGLGEYSYTVTKIVDETRGETDRMIRRAVESAVAEGDDPCVLFYYFGHGVIRQGLLYFICKDSDTERTATMIGAHQVAEIIAGHGIGRTVIVLDCCYAGAAPEAIADFAGAGDHAVLTSALPLQRAEVQPGPTPFGGFSLFFFRALTDPDAARTPNDEVTVRSAFDYAYTKLQQDGFRQLPQFTDAGLGGLILSEARPQRAIQPEFNSDAPTKSYYRKIWWIGRRIRMGEANTTDGLYGVVVRDEPAEMMTPVRTEEGIDYQPIKLTTFRNYVDRMQDLGILVAGEQLALTDSGRRMFTQNGQQFNAVLVDLIDAAFQDAGRSLADIDRSIRFTLHTRRIPSTSNVHFDVRNRGGLRMTKRLFGILLDLAAYAGYWRHSSSKTYYSF